jgi:hypothetical protein
VGIGLAIYPATYSITGAGACGWLAEQRSSFCYRIANWPGPVFIAAARWLGDKSCPVANPPPEATSLKKKKSGHGIGTATEIFSEFCFGGYSVAVVPTKKFGHGSGTATEIFSEFCFGGYSVVVVPTKKFGHGIGTATEIFFKF